MHGDLPLSIEEAIALLETLVEDYIEAEFFELNVIPYIQDYAINLRKGLEERADAAASLRNILASAIERNFASIANGLRYSENIEEEVALLENLTTDMADLTRASKALMRPEDSEIRPNGATHDMIVRAIYG